MANDKIQPLSRLILLAERVRDETHLLHDDIKRAERSVGCGIHEAHSAILSRLWEWHDEARRVLAQTVEDSRESYRESYYDRTYDEDI